MTPDLGNAVTAGTYLRARAKGTSRSCVESVTCRYRGKRCSRCDRRLVRGICIRVGCPGHNLTGHRALGGRSTFRYDTTGQPPVSVSLPDVLRRDA